MFSFIEKHPIAPSQEIKIYSVEDILTERARVLNKPLGELIDQFTAGTKGDLPWNYALFVETFNGETNDWMGPKLASSIRSLLPKASFEEFLARIRR